MKTLVNKKALSEDEFNQIYTKLVTSIQKSLDQYDNSERLFWYASATAPNCKPTNTKDEVLELSTKESDPRSRTTKHRTYLQSLDVEAKSSNMRITGMSTKKKYDPIM